MVPLCRGVKKPAPLDLVTARLAAIPAAQRLPASGTREHSLGRFGSRGLRPQPAPKQGSRVFRLDVGQMRPRSFCSSSGGVSLPPEWSPSRGEARVRGAGCPGDPSARVANPNLKSPPAHLKDNWHKRNSMEDTVFSQRHKRPEGTTGFPG